ncbi:MAG: hypothetical protein OHK0046_34400 [Anaerolineae bacterium]
MSITLRSTIQGKTEGSEHHFDLGQRDAIHIGRHSPQDPDLPEHIINLAEDIGVSRKHALIMRDDYGYYIQDRNSTYGTYVNDKRIEAWANERLFEGHHLRLSQHTLIEVVTIRTKVKERTSDKLPLAPSQTYTVIEEVPANQSPSMLIAAADTAAMDTVMNYLNALHVLNTLMSQATDIDRLLQVLLEQIFDKIAHVSSCGVLRLDERGLSQSADYCLPPGKEQVHSTSLVTDAVRARRAILANLSDPTVSMQHFDIQSAMAAPLTWADQDYGVVYANSAENGDAFGPDEIRLLQMLAQQTAIYIHNHQLQHHLHHRALIHANLSKHFNNEVAEHLLAGDWLHEGKSSSRPATLLYMHLRWQPQAGQDATAPARIEAMLSARHLLSEIVFAHKGSIISAPGELLLAAFGLPVADAQHQTHAIQAAVTALQEIAHVTEHFKATFGLTPMIGMALDTDSITFGLSPEGECTILGEAVARVQGYLMAAAEGQIVLTTPLYKAAADALPATITAQPQPPLHILTLK